MAFSLSRPLNPIACLLKRRRLSVVIRPGAAIFFTLLMVCSAYSPAFALEKKPYDKQLLRLSELLGAVHYLRELCGANEGQLWRKHMSEIMKAEGSTALRRLSLTRRFNFGYRSYSRTYSHCTPSAQTAISRFVNEAALISDTMVRNIP